MVGPFVVFVVFTTVVLIVIVRMIDSLGADLNHFQNWVYDHLKDKR